jgi:glycerol uptake facilitator-like aquaporin
MRRNAEPTADAASTRRVVAEALGTALLVAVVIGSGIMAARLSGGNAAIALLANALATGAGLVVLILLFGPISGAHFNPIVSLVLMLRGEMPARQVPAYVLAQALGAVAGAGVAHLMFDLPVLQISTTLRDGSGQWFAEGVATFGLILVVIGCARQSPQAVPYAVGLYITAAYWFTASTSFANPAVTLGRCLTDTFSGIAPQSAPEFVVAQVLGGLLAYHVAELLWPRGEAA